MNDLYKILNVDKKATKKQIKNSFRKMAKKYHPDKNPGSDNNNDKFATVNNAYSILEDDIKKKEYDKTGEVNQQNEKTAPLDKIAKLFLAMLDNKNINIIKINIIKNITDSLIKEKKEAKLFIETATKYSKLMKTVNARIERTKKSVPLFMNIINNRISLINKDIEKKKDEIELIDKSLKILKSYKDNVNFDQYTDLGSIFAF